MSDDTGASHGSKRLWWGILTALLVPTIVAIGSYARLTERVNAHGERIDEKANHEMVVTQYEAIKSWMQSIDRRLERLERP